MSEALTGCRHWFCRLQFANIGQRPSREISGEVFHGVALSVSLRSVTMTTAGMACNPSRTATVLIQGQSATWRLCFIVSVPVRLQLDWQLFTDLNLFVFRCLVDCRWTVAKVAFICPMTCTVLCVLDNRRKSINQSTNHFFQATRSI